MSVELSVEKPRATSIIVWIIAAPFLLFSVGLGYLVWEMDISLFAKTGYLVGFALIAYWLFSPKSPRHIIVRQVVSLLIIWGVIIVIAFTWALIELRPEMFEGLDAQNEELRTGRMVMLGWSIAFGVAAYLASRRIYRALQRNLQLSGLFSRYVSPAVISQMLQSKDDFFKTQKTELSVMFVDLRGFTATSERLAADQVRDLINTFMGVMIPVAHSWRGTVDKTVGDEIMVLFGAPIPYPDHADQCVKTAMAFLRAHSQVVQKWQERGLPVLEMGIGVNSGEMVVGNIGCDERVDYTVLGHHVNLGARLCGKAAGSQILVSEFTHHRLSIEMKSQVAFQSPMEVEAKGVEGTVKAFPLTLS